MRPPIFVAFGLLLAGVSACTKTSTASVSPSASKVVVTPSAGVLADGTTTASIAVTLVNAAGERMVNTAVDISVSGSDNQLSTPSPTNANGQTAALLSSTFAETKTVTVTAGGVPLVAQPTVQFVYPPPSAFASSLTASPNMVVADGQQSAAIVLTVLSAQHTPIPGAAVTLSVDKSNGFDLAASSGSTDPNGVFSTTLTSTRGIPATVTAQVPGLSLSAGVSFAVPACKGTVVMTQPPAPATGIQPMNLAVGDVNGDSHADVAIALMEGGIGLLLGNGDGTFGPQTSLATDSNAIRVALSDVSGDGLLDIVSLHNPTSPGELFVQVATGQGTFAAAVQTNVTGAVQDLAVGELSGDTLKDAVVTSTLDANIRVLFSAGAGAFAAPILLPSVSMGASVVVADFNSDHLNDIAAAGNQSLTVFLNAGNGNFVALPPVSYVGTGTALLLSLYINKDSLPDLFVSTTSGATAFINDGNATFTSYSQNAKGTLGAAADFNGDGNIDLMLGSVSLGSSGEVSLYIGDGNSTFTNTSTINVTVWMEDTAVGDINGDGTPDLLVADGGTNSLDVILWQPHASAAPQTGDANYLASGYMVSNDFDNDGVLDLGISNDGNVTILLGAGDGNFAGPPALVNAGGLQEMDTADYNGDHWPDLVTITSQPALQIYWGNGAGSLNPNAATVDANSTTYVSVKSADFNGDGLVDLAAGSSDANNQVTVFLNTGHGEFTLSQVLDGNATDFLQVVPVAGDFRGKGVLDIAVANNTDQDIYIHTNDGDGHFAPGQRSVTNSNGSSYRWLTVAYINNDSYADIVAMVDGGGNALHVLLSDGNGSFQDFTQLGWYTAALGAPSVADFNGDGINDILTAAPGTASFNIYFGNGDGTFGYAVVYPSATSVDHWLTGDFNADGWPDVVSFGGGTAPVTTTLHTACLGDSLVAPDRGGQDPAPIFGCSQVASCSGPLSFLLGLLFLLRYKLGRAPAAQ